MGKAKYVCLGALALTVGLATIPGCGCDREFEVRLLSSQIDDAIAFEGSWTKRRANANQGVVGEETYDVVASGVRYRVVRHRESFDDIKVFDGQQVFEQSVQTSDDFRGATTGGRVFRPKLSDATLSKARFWARKVRGSAGEGDIVCGRSTRYFVEPSKDGRIFLEIWLDHEHDVMLRRRVTIMNADDASRVGAEPSRISEVPEDQVTVREWQCESIEFGAAGPESFDAPSPP